jgi:hypothetical protein
MTGKQNAVMWLGLILIVTRLFTTKQWSQLWGTLDTGSSASGSSGSGNGGVIGLGNPVGNTTLPPAVPGAPNLTIPSQLPAGMSRLTGGLWPLVAHPPLFYR